MNIQEALTEAKAGKFVARGSEPNFEDAIFYIPPFVITPSMANDIPAPGGLAYTNLDGGFFRKYTRPDTSYGVEKYKPTYDDILATDWTVFNI